MNNFKASYEKILEVMQSKTVKHNFIPQKRKPKLSDIELISLELTAQYMSIDSECQVFRTLFGSDLADKIERTEFTIEEKEN